MFKTRCVDVVTEDMKSVVVGEEDADEEGN